MYRMVWLLVHRVTCYLMHSVYNRILPLTYMSISSFLYHCIIFRPIMDFVEEPKCKRLKSIYQTGGLETASSVNGAIKQHTYTSITIYKCLFN